MKKLMHKIAHKLGWNYGTCHSFYIENKLYMGFKCTGCGEINHCKPIDKIIDRELNLTYNK